MRIRPGFWDTKLKIERIEDFNDDFDFPNNEFECPVWFGDLEYPNAYQAARRDLDDLARQVNNQVGWEYNKLGS